MRQPPRAPDVQSPDALFAYGTLLFASVLHAVVGGDLPSVAATLEGFVRRRLIGEVFPAIIEAPGESVDGLLYEGVDQDAWRRLDTFEGALYERRAVTVTVAPGDPARAAFTYVLRGSWRHRLAPERWSPEEFARDHLAAFEARLERGAAPRARS